MNVHQLSLPPLPQLRRSSSDASDKDADFLALRLVNKRARLRLSSEPIQLDALPGKGRLFSVANHRGWFAAAVVTAGRSHALVLSPLSQLRKALASSSSTDSPPSIQPQCTLPLSLPPHLVAFTNDNGRLLVAFVNGSLSVYDSQLLFQGSASSILHTFPSSHGSAIRDLLPSTGEPQHVAVLRDPTDPLPVEILDVQSMTSVGGWSGAGSPATIPTSLSWSQKGKQIAIGLQSGDIVTFNPADTSAVKSVVPHPPSVEGQSVISISWLSNTEFHAIYAPPGPLLPDAEQTHFILSLDTKANTAGDLKLSSPYLPFPGLRPPGSFTVSLRAWDPARILLFVGDSTSSDIGLVGTLSDSGWYNLTLEETSTPSVPLDTDLNETVILGLDLDLTDDQTFKYTSSSGEEMDVPPPPIMYLYASDGTITAWHLVQTQGLAYPGMLATSDSTITSPPVADSQMTTPTPQPSVFAASTSPALSNAFASISPQNTAPSSTSGGFGFSAFSGAPAAFGTTSLGFNSQSNQSAQSQLAAPPMTAPSKSVDMASSADEASPSSFRGLSLGGGEESSSSIATNSMFGSFGSNLETSPSPFGAAPSAGTTFGTFGSGPIKPATAFGATQNTGTSAFGSSSGFGGGAFSAGGSAFSGGAFSGGAFSGGAFSSGASAFGSKPASENATPKPLEATATSGSGQFGGAGSTSAFGQPSFGNSTFGTSTFGQSSFGQSSFGQTSFGQSSFGQSSFGQSATPASAAPKPTVSAFGSTGGFASFATAGPSAFSAVAQHSSSKDTKPVWAAVSSEPTESMQPAAPPTKAPTPSPEMSHPAATTPPATPPAKQVAQPVEATIPATPAPSSGAFGGLTTSTVGFSKLQPGFGAFSTTTTSASSPFLQKPSTTTPPTSFFGQTSFGSTTPASNEDASKPTFGATSFGKPSFGTTPSYFGSLATSSPFGKPASGGASSTPKTPTIPAAPPVSAFSAFSGSSSPFGAAAASSSGKSFGEMLRQKSGDGEVKEQNEETRPTGFSRTAEEWKKPVSAFASLKTTESKAEEEDGEGEEDEGADISFRSHEDDDEVDEGDDGIDAFLKSDDEYLPSDEEEREEEEEEQEDEEEAATVAPDSPTVKQAPVAKAQSIFSGSVFSSQTPPEEKEAGPSKITPPRAASTTPPGSPADQVSPPPPSTSKPTIPPTSRPTSAPPMSTVGGLLGVGRPSTRPVRSSPLASRPISGDDGEEDENGRLASPSSAKKARSASPAIPVPGDSTTRPKTPPALFGTSFAPPKPPPFSLASAASSPTGPGKSPSPVVDKAEAAKAFTPPATPTLSGPGTPGPSSLFATVPPVFTPPVPVPAGTQKPTTPTLPAPVLAQSKPTVPLFSGGGLFASSITPAPTKTPSPAPTTAPAAATPKMPLFPSTTAIPPPTTAGFSSLSLPQPAVPSQPAPGPAKDMQSECANLYLSLNKELEDLKAQAAQARARAVQLSKPGSGTKTSHDLTQPTKWVLSDLSQFKHIMTEVERELEKWQSAKTTCVSYLRELESDVLKASTRKEEIDRFRNASKDTDFAKMLKARMLSPDHLETQSQLRREIRTIRSRLQQLEEYIQASKKKLNSVKTGKATLRPPSLDTINRTYRNIDIAIDQEEEDVSNLTERLAKLEMSSNSPLTSLAVSSRDKRLPDRSRRVGREVTPNIAASTAATLNAERSAQKLKRALLKVRKEPLLNTKAIDAVPPERELRTPRKPLLASGSGFGVGAAFTAGLTGGLPALSLTPVKAEPETPTTLQWTPPPPGSLPPPAWSLPPFQLDSAGGSPLAGLGSGRGRGGREKQHAKPIQLHQGQKPPPPPPPPGFSWGPVPVLKPKLAGFVDLKGKGKDVS